MPEAESADRLAQHLESLREADRRAVEVAMTSTQNALEAVERLSQERIASVQREALAGLEANAEAITKAENATDRRFEAVERVIGAQLDDIRGQLNVLDELKANERLQVERVESLRREQTAQHVSDQEALAKVDAANENRFTSVNEFRAELRDRFERNMPREVAEAQISEVRKITEARYQDLSTKLSRVDTVLAEQQGSSKATITTVGIMLTVFALVISGLVVLLNIVTGS